jgi:hypothetical protein
MYYSPQQHKHSCGLDLRARFCQVVWERSWIVLVRCTCVIIRQPAEVLRQRAMTRTPAHGTPGNGQLPSGVDRNGKDC